MARRIPPRIRSIHLDYWHRPIRAVIVTRHGLVRVRWQTVGKGWRWTAYGNRKAKDLAFPAIEHIEQMCQSMT